MYSQKSKGTQMRSSICWLQEYSPVPDHYIWLWFLQRTLSGSGTRGLIAPHLPLVTTESRVTCHVSRWCNVGCGYYLQALLATWSLVRRRGTVNWSFMGTASIKIILLFIGDKINLAISVYFVGSKRVYCWSKHLRFLFFWYCLHFLYSFVFFKRL